MGLEPAEDENHLEQFIKYQCPKTQGKKSKCPPTVEGISKLPDSHVVEYYTALKKGGHTTYLNMEEPHSSNVEQKKPDTKEHFCVCEV